MLRNNWHAEFRVKARCKQHCPIPIYSVNVHAETKSSAATIAAGFLRDEGLRSDWFFKPKVTPLDDMASAPQESLTNGTKEQDQGHDQERDQGHDRAQIRKPEEPTGPSLDQQVSELNLRIEKLAPGERLRLEGVPAEVYHATRGCGSTLMKKFMKAPRLYKAAIDGELEETGDHFDLGRAIHDAVLLPECFKTDYVRQSDEIKVRRGKVWDAFKEAHAGKTIISRKDYDYIEQVKNGVMSASGQFFRGGVAEVSYWLKLDSGVVLKARTDYELKAGERTAIVDLKTIEDASNSSCTRAITKYGYDTQAELYKLVTGYPEMSFVFVEKKPPFMTNVFRVGDDESCRQALTELVSAIDKMSACNEFDIWGGYGNDVKTYVRPVWKKREFEEAE